MIGTASKYPFRCPKTQRSFTNDGFFEDKPSESDLVMEYVDHTTSPLTVEDCSPNPSLLLGIVYDALSGARGPNQQRLAQRGMQVTELLLRKNKDYGESAWTPPVLAPGLTARQTIQCRMSDKVARLHRLFSGATAEVNDESIEVTMLDLVGYGILWLEAPTK
jgi:hypothetical protein